MLQGNGACVVTVRNIAMLGGLRGVAQLIEPCRKAQVIHDHGPEVAGQGVPLRRTGALVGALRGAGGSNRSSCTGGAVMVATTSSTGGKSATLGGRGRLRGGAWPLVGRQFALQALQRASHAVLDSVAGDHAGGAAVALGRGVDPTVQLGT